MICQIYITGEIDAIIRIYQHAGHEIEIKMVSALKNDVTLSEYGVYLLYLLMNAIYCVTPYKWIIFMHGLPRSKVFVPDMLFRSKYLGECLLSIEDIKNQKKIFWYLFCCPKRNVKCAKNRKGGNVK